VKLRLMTLMAILVLAGALLAAPLAALAAPAAATAPAVPISGTFTDQLGGTGTFSGTLTLQNFAVQNGQLVANGLVSGTLTDSQGNVVGTVSNVPATFPVAHLSSSCTILALDLGPIHLNLLGLVVNTNAIHLRITAQPGPGNLLGNLLCALAHLLDRNPPLGAVVFLLNQILNHLPPA